MAERKLMKKTCLNGKCSTILNATPRRLVMDLLICFQIISIISIIFSNGVMSGSLFWSGNSAAVFPDVMETAFQSYELRPYETGAIYPPLVYVVFHVFTWFLPESFFSGMNLDNWGELWNKATMTQQGHGITVVFLCISAFLLYIALRDFVCEHGDVGLKPLLWITFTCAPMLFLIERGNILLLMMAPLLYFCANYRSERTCKRMLAYLCLALVVSFKIYPVFLGLLLLSDSQVKKKGRAVACCVTMGIVAFLLPFALTGGMNSFWMLLGNIEKYTGASFNMFGLGDKVNLGNTVKIFLSLFFQKPFFEDTPRVQMAQNIAVVVSILVGVASAFLNRQRWKKIASLVLVFVMLPSFSVRYNMVYMIIPLAFFFYEPNRKGVLPWVYAVLFALCLAPMAFGVFSIYNTYNFKCALNLSTIVPSFTMPIMLAVLVCDGFVSRIKHNTEVIEADEVLEQAVKRICTLRYYGILAFSAVAFALLTSWLTRLAMAALY